MTTPCTLEENLVVRQFIEEVTELIPAKDRDVVFDALKRYKSSTDLPGLIEDLKVVLDDPSKLEVFEYIRPLIPAKHQMEFDRLAPPPPGLKRRVINLRRRHNESLGFAVRGGFEHGIGVFVSHIELGSQAEQQGLRVGDEIVRVNGFTIAQAIHEEVLNLIKGRDAVELKVTNIGMLPVKERRGDTVTWKYVEKQEKKKRMKKSHHRHIPEEEQGEVVKLFANLRTSPTLGCSIASDVRGKGIYIQRVGPDSLGEQIGLEVGDQILEVNGTSFMDITHNEAVVALKSSKELNLVIRKKSKVQTSAVNSHPSPPLPPPKENKPPKLKSSPVPNDPVYAVVVKETKEAPPPAPPPPPPPPPPPGEGPDRPKPKKPAPVAPSAILPKIDFTAELKKVNLRRRLEKKDQDSGDEEQSKKDRHFNMPHYVKHMRRNVEKDKAMAGLGSVKDERKGDGDATLRLEKLLQEKLTQQRERDERLRQEVYEDNRKKRNALEHKLLEEIRQHRQDAEKEQFNLRLQRRQQDVDEMQREVEGSGSDILRGRGAPLKKPEFGLLGPSPGHGFTIQTADQQSSSSDSSNQDEMASNPGSDFYQSPISDIDELLVEKRVDHETPQVIYVDRVSTDERLPYTYID